MDKQRKLITLDDEAVDLLDQLTTPRKKGEYISELIKRSVSVEVDAPDADLGGLWVYYSSTSGNTTSATTATVAQGLVWPSEGAMVRSRGEGFGDEVKRRIMTGTYVLSAGYYDAYYLKAQQVRQLIADDFRKAFADVDVIAGPTAPAPAFRLGDKVDDPIQMYLNDIYTIGANLAGLPGISTPCGFVGGLPVGLHLVGPHFGESALLRCTHQYQQATDWHTQAPEGFS